MRKIWNKEVIAYIFAGISTTIVNFVIYYGLTRWLDLNVNYSNLVSIFISIQFAFIVNERYVFISNEKRTHKKHFQLMASFYLSRIIAMGVDMMCFYLLSTQIGLNDLISKVAVAFIIIVFNYLMSKFLVFRNRRSING